MRTTIKILCAISFALMASCAALYAVSFRTLSQINWTPVESKINLTKGTSLQVSFRPDYTAMYQLCLRFYTNMSTLGKSFVRVQNKMIVTNSVYPEFPWIQNRTTTHVVMAQESYTNLWLDEVRHYLEKDDFSIEYSVISPQNTNGTGIISNDDIRGSGTDYIEGRITNLDLIAGIDYLLSARVLTGTGLLNKETPTLTIEIDPLVFKGRYVVAQMIALPANGLLIVGLASGIVGAMLHISERKRK